MKVPSFANFARKLTAFIPKQDIEKLVFKMLVGLWLVVSLMAIVSRTVVGIRNDIESVIMESATGGKIPAVEKSDIERYESLLNLAKYPEEMKGHISTVKRDPFLEYSKDVAAHPLGAGQYDFVLKSVSRIQLPLVYKGYIELPDKIIGQVNWREATKFVTVDSTINGYRIHSISKDKLVATDEKYRKIEFKLKKPVFSDELQAMLYDNISKKTYIVYKASKIDNYEVAEITRHYVLLRFNESEIKLEKSP